MRRKLSLTLLVVLLCLSSRAQETDIYGMMSPNLRQFLSDHREVANAVSNVLSEVSEMFSNRTVQLYYFYSDDKSVARASHYSPDWYRSVIGIKENQQPGDQCICLIFELLNSEGDKRFGETCQEAVSGKIKRADFAREMLRQEYQAVRKIQKLLQDFKLGKSEFAGSDYYKAFIDCPDTFEAFLNYETSVVSERNSFKEYEQEYDTMRKAQQRPNMTIGCKG
jgi:hypothetical protein